MACKYLTTGTIGQRRRASTMVDHRAPVGGRAIPSGRTTKADHRLSIRKKDYETMMVSKNHAQGPEKRMFSGGYHCPGSLQCK